MPKASGFASGSTFEGEGEKAPTMTSLSASLAAYASGMDRDTPEALFLQKLLAARSATDVLQDYCAIEGETIRVEQMAGDVPPLPPPPLPEPLRQALGVGSEERIAHRRVRLVCAGQVFSEADNWYLADRLTPEMNAALLHGDTPFGRIVAPLNPYRHTLDAAAADAPYFLKVTAILRAENGQPLSAVIEFYQKAVLGPA